MPGVHPEPILNTSLPAQFRQIRIELAREPGHPEGDTGYAYVIVAPLDAEDRIDAKLQREHHEACRVTRLRPDQDDQQGLLVHRGGGWAFQDYVLGNVQRVDAFDGLKNRPDTGPEGSMNILLAGVDRREGLTDQQIRDLHLGKVGGQRSDTMMLVHISSKHDKVTVVSLPRDSLVTIPAHRSNGSEGANGAEIGERQGKLNWAYMYGGAPLTVQTVERATGVHVDHYIEVEEHQPATVG